MAKSYRSEYKKTDRVNKKITQTKERKHERQCNKIKFISNDENYYDEC